MFKSKLIQIVIFISIIGLISCSTVKQESTGNTSKITIDGNIDDWDVPLDYYQKEGIRAGFKNDAENLYIAVIINDQSVIRQIKMSGLEIWIDDKGSSDKKVGFRYPIGMSRIISESGRAGFDSQKFDKRRNGVPNEMVFDFNDRLEELRIITDKDIDGTIINLKKNNQLSVAMKYENYTLKYEIKIPFKKADNLLGLNIDMSKEISVGFVTEKPDYKNLKKPGSDFVGDPDDNQSPAMGATDGAMGGPGGSIGRPGAGMGGARMGAAGAQMPTNLDFWISVKLISFAK